MHDRKIGLTVFLLKESQLPKFEEDLIDPLRETAIPLVGSLIGFFVPLPAYGEAPPVWVLPVTTMLSQPITADMGAKAPGGLLVLRHNARTFVVTFGHAWQKLEDVWLEPDFGLRVALNVIPRKDLVEIRAEQVFARWHLASERAPRASSVDEFGVDFDRDLVAVLEGVPRHRPRLGKTIRGSTSLKLHLPLSELEAVFDTALERFLSADYKGDWPEIDNISPFRDEDIIPILEEQLGVALEDENLRAGIAMFTPSQRKGEPFVADSYVYGRLGKMPSSTPYLTLEGWSNFLARTDQIPSLDTAKRTAVHMFDETGLAPRNVRVFDCLGWDYADGQRVFVLSSGAWYEVSLNFVANINNAVRNIGLPQLYLPPWNGEHSEGEYNAACATQCRFLNCDAKNVFFGGGHSQLEFCDMLDPQTKTLMFAKIVSRSSGMSHLTEQVRRTVQLLFSGDGAYRQKLIALFQRHYPAFDTSWLEQRPRNGDWNFCLVSLGTAAAELPFFAKCGLARTCKELTEQGHPVSFIAV